MEIGKKIREIRRRVGISQEDLSEKAEINRTYLSQIENGKSSPTEKKIKKIAEALGVPASELMEETTPYSGEAPTFEYDADAIPAGLVEFLNDERTLLLMNPTTDEVEILKSIRFIDSFRPSKQFFMEALIEHRRSRER
jgi:transcriptional regulator with XRE-family HTH domain